MRLLETRRRARDRHYCQGFVPTFVPPTAITDLTKMTRHYLKKRLFAALFLMARPGLEPGTPRFSVVGRPTRPAVRTVAEIPAFAGVLCGLRRQSRPALSAEIPADTRRCRGVWADGRCRRPKQKGAGRAWREADSNRRHLDFQCYDAQSPASSPICRILRTTGPGEIPSDTGDSAGFRTTAGGRGLELYADSWLRVDFYVGCWIGVSGTTESRRACRRRAAIAAVWPPCGCSPRCRGMYLVGLISSPRPTV